jgi:hypothetical protein
VGLADWTKDVPADAVDLTRPGALPGLLAAYGGAQPEVLRTVLARAYDLGAQSAVLEYRYLDPDYRNEHSRFYSTTFRRYPSVAHRLHFFAKPVPPALLSDVQPARFNDLDYLGYTVLRPVPGAPVGRTMLRPHEDVATHITCLATDTVHLLGERLTVAATPFMAQDAQLSICAHADLWMVARYHHLRFGGPSVLPGDIADAAPQDIGRGTPSSGLSLYQISVASGRLGLPALVYKLDPPPDGESLFRIACRYLNSGMPVIVGGDEHAFVLVGYERVNSGKPDERIYFFRHDDESGPYGAVENWMFDEYSPWDYLVVPLPAKVYLSGEEAEVIGEEHLRQALEDHPSPEAAAMLKQLDDPAHPVSFRTTVIQSNDFKTGLEQRGVPEDLAAIYRRMQMSRWVWVVELQDRALRDDSDPFVLAEVIIDATDHVRDRHVLAYRIPGVIAQWDPDADKIDFGQLAAMQPLRPVSPREARG